jgi:hypothetical protein
MISKNDIRKSVNTTASIVIGKTILGKYTFVSNPAFPVRQLAQSESRFENRYHGSIPANTINPYGKFAESMFASEPKITVKTTMVRNGLITTQATPISVCLYLTMRSRLAR